MKLEVGDHVLVIWNNKLQPARVLKKLPAEIKLMLEESRRELWVSSQGVIPRQNGIDIKTEIREACREAVREIFSPPVGAVMIDGKVVEVKL